MTPREVIKRNLTHDNPIRLGLCFDRGRRNDFCINGLGPSSTFQERIWVDGTVEYRDDEWGNTWHRFIDASTGGEIFRPAIEDWAQMKDLRIPDFDDPARYQVPQAAFAAEPDKYHLAAMPGWVFATSRYLRKMEIYFMDLVLYRDEIDRLHDIVTGLLERVLDQVATTGADGIFFFEDLGIQDRLLIGPAMWRDIFAPHYHRLCGRAHARGLQVFMHSCGYNWDLLDDLMDAGIDCFQFDQPAIYDQPALAAKLRERKVALFSPVDIQQVLPTGNRNFIEQEARKMVELFGGGLIMKNYPDLHGIGVKEEWDDWAYQAILQKSVEGCG